MGQTQHDFNPKLQPGRRTRSGAVSHKRATTEPPSIDLAAALERLKAFLDERDEDSGVSCPGVPEPAHTRNVAPQPTQRAGTDQ